MSQAVRVLQECADHDFAYEDILGKPHEQMAVLAGLLGMEDQARPCHAMCTAFHFCTPGQTS